MTHMREGRKRSVLWLFYVSCFVVFVILEIPKIYSIYEKLQHIWPVKAYYIILKTQRIQINVHTCDNNVINLILDLPLILIYWHVLLSRTHAQGVKQSVCMSVVVVIVCTKIASLGDLGP